MTVKNDVAAIKARLDEGQIQGYVQDLADEVGLDVQRVNVALSYIRHHCRTSGWTVPYVAPGPGMKVFRAVEAPEVGGFVKDDRMAINGGEAHNYRHAITRIKGWGEEMGLIAAHTDQRTAIGKKARMIHTSVMASLAAIEALDFLGEIEGEGGAAA